VFASATHGFFLFELDSHRMSQQTFGYELMPLKYMKFIKKDKYCIGYCATSELTFWHLDYDKKTQKLSKIDFHSNFDLDQLDHAFGTPWFEIDSDGKFLYFV
jgi:hypothetical protein